jgi:hypothetical protein
MGALAGNPPASNYATLATRNAHPILQYDAATEETTSFELILPAHYSGGGLTLVIYWMATSATSGAVVWGAAIERHQASTDDLDSDSFATEQTATTTTAGTSGQIVTTSITFTSGAVMDSLAASESFRLKVARKAADGSDTMAGDSEILNLLLKET